MLEVYFFDHSHLSDPEFATDMPSGALTIFRALKLPDGMPFVLDYQGSAYPLVNSFLRDLPAWRCPSRNTWRTYAYQLVGLHHFLGSLDPPKTLLDAKLDDLKAYRNDRRGGSPPAVTATSWNLGLSAFEKFFEWAKAENYRADVPFRYGQQNGHRSRGPIKINLLREPVGADNRVKCISLEEYRTFRAVGLLGMDSDLRSRDPDFCGRNGTRNSALADFMVNTGLRVTEAVSVLTPELPKRDPSRRKGAYRFEVASEIAKRRKGRSAIVSEFALLAVDRYFHTDRDNAICQGLESGNYEAHSWRRIESDGPLACRFLDDPSHAKIKYDMMDPALRRRLMLTDADGKPVAPAIVWLGGSNGKPITSDNVRMVFKRACERCSTVQDRHFDITPHTLRHTFAVYTLTLLLREQMRIKEAAELREFRSRHGAEALFEYVINPLRVLKTLLGHSSVESTFKYLTHFVDARDFEESTIHAWGRELRGVSAIVDEAIRFDQGGTTSEEETEG